MNGPPIVLVGAAGNPGGRVVKALLERGTAVTTHARQSAAPDKLERLRDVIVEAQAILLDATIKAGVPRFIPSGYSMCPASDQSLMRKGRVSGFRMGSPGSNGKQYSIS
jgi:nucleoside-diphosphate-sugar epimerase